MKLGRSNFGAVIAEGKIIVAGGFSEPMPVGEVECFDLEHQTWSQLCEMILPKSALSLIFLPGVNLIHPDLRAPQCEELPDGAVVVDPANQIDSSWENLFEN